MMKIGGVEEAPTPRQRRDAITARTPHLLPAAEREPRAAAAASLADAMIDRESPSTAKTLLGADQLFQNCELIAQEAGELAACRAA